MQYSIETTTTTQFVRNIIMTSRFATAFTNLVGRRNPDFSWKDVWLQWSLGVFASTPILALLQGTLLLNDYRVQYADAPRPVMPARGVAVAIEDDKQDEHNNQTKSTYAWRLRHPFSVFPQPDPHPLRLLVVGDSLAAGVGMSKSGVPILPESIARALSKALHGRAVYWTCVGTPGVAASQIVRDIHDIEPYDPHPRARKLERLVKEFQARRRRWLERRRQEELINTTDDNIDTSSNTSKENQMQKSNNFFLQWWKQIRQNEQRKSPKEIRETTVEVAREWWTQFRNRFRKKKEQVEEDITAIKVIVLEPLPNLDDDLDDDYYYDYFRENRLGEQREVENDKDKKERLPLVHKGGFFRRTSVNPEAAAQYDVAVVLTGLNDVKYAFMPHMTIGKGNNNGDIRERKLKHELFRVLEALQGKMGQMDLKRNTQDGSEMPLDSPGVPNQEVNQASENKVIDLKRPLVVVPELPVAPLQLFRLVPLCWFLIPIFRAMEENKKFLASCFPEYVVFVEQPDLQWWTDQEAGIGPVRENIKKEQLLLRVTDTAQQTRERIEQVMKKYYDAKRQRDSLAKTKETPSNAMEGETNIRMIDDHDHPHFDEDCNSQKSVDGQNDTVMIGSHLVSADKVHPNDEGYELWGRHIAAAIIDHWNKDKPACPTPK